MYCQFWIAKFPNPKFLLDVETSPECHPLDGVGIVASRERTPAATPDARLQAPGWTV